MSFLDNIWKQLKEKKKTQVNQKDPKFQEVYQGYRTIPIQKLARKNPNKANQDDKGINLWKSKETTEVYSYMENAKFTNDADNGFFTAFYQAYMQHGDIKIKPDEVWMIIMQWFTKYVNKNSEQLRSAFVVHEEKKELVVKTNKDLYNWEPFLYGVIQQIKANTVKGVVEQLECNFTSTGLFEWIFSTALIMNTCKKYFVYSREGAGCGIVNVHMAGTLQDWEKLEKKLANLAHFDVNGTLKKYIKDLRPVLNQFTQTYKGNANLQFWNNMYFERPDHDSDSYFPTSIINGWLIKFFTTKNEITEVQQLKAFKVDINYIDIDTKQVTYFNLNGGCKGYSCVDDYTYTPHYSFAIVIDEKKMKSLKKEAKQVREIIFKKQSVPKVIKKLAAIEPKNVKLEMLNIYQPGFKKIDQKKTLKIVPSTVSRPQIRSLSLAKKQAFKKEENEETKHRKTSTRK